VLIERRLHLTYIVILIISILPIVAFGQIDNTSKFINRSSIHFEVGGRTSFYGIEYEHALINRPRLKTMITGGVGYYSNTLGMPLSLSQLFSFGKHHLELMISPLFLFHRYQNFALQMAGSFGIGYRHQKSEGRLILRASFNPMILIGSAIPGFRPWGGASIGYTLIGKQKE
jgi:hypothetical protein